MSAILIGCDPEVFVSQKGTFLSAFGLIKGDKKNPEKIRRGAVQVDGMALEFNIDPAATEEEFCINVNDVFSQMKAMVPTYDVVVSPVANFDPEYMKSQPFEALQLGCDPDFNAWKNGEINEKPNGDWPFRTASGHIHIGWTEGQSIEDADHLHRCMMVTRQMDFYLALGSIFYDEDQKRRTMYGAPGCFRPKSYGVEYRTLSNMWLSSQNLISWVYRNSVKGITDLMNGRVLEDKYGDIQRVILESDKDAAIAIIRDEQLEMPNV
jgi:hypothetical protein